MTTPTLTFDDAVRIRLVSAEQQKNAERIVSLASTTGRGGRSLPHPWYQTLGETVLRRLFDRTARLCPHIGPDYGVGPMFTVMQTDTMHIQCQTCWTVNKVHLEPAEDMTCDRCQTYAHALAAGVLPIGPLLVIFGLCEACDRQLDRESRQRTTPRGNRGHNRGRGR